MTVRRGMSVKTCRIIAAAPLRPPPRAFFRVAPRSNYATVSIRKNIVTNGSSAAIYKFVMGNT